MRQPGQQQTNTNLSDSPELNGALSNCETAESMVSLASALFPICRSITGPGLRKSLDLIAKQIPLAITEVPSGSKVLDWTVPPEWTIRDAFIEAVNGERLLDFNDNNLHVVNYSDAVDEVVSKDEVLARTHRLKDSPNQIPYRTSYYQRRWGFCAAQAQVDGWKSDSYRVCVDADFNASGSLTYGELFLPGQTRDEIVFSSHICHPSLANDNLSANVVACELAQFIAAKPRRYSYRFLFAPGTIGTIAWLGSQGHRIANIRGGLVLALLGDEHGLSYKPTCSGSSQIDSAVRSVLKNFEDSRELKFAPTGYDERQYASADLPIGRLCRSTEYDYAFYHTSDDNLANLKPAKLVDSLEALKAVVECLEADIIIKRRWACEPQLGKRGLYPIEADRPADSQSALLWNLALADGNRSLRTISEESGIEYETHKKMASRLVEEELALESNNWQPKTASPSHGKPSNESLIKNRRAHELIPGGAHTYAKGDDQFPVNAPRFFDRGTGCCVFDSDGNRFIEFGMGLRAVGLGHAYPPIVRAVQQQLELGSNFTRPASIEVELAESFLNLVPSAEMVKFTKNGSDATTAAIRLARAATQRSKVLVCAEHPFFSVDDWFIGLTPMRAGIPSETTEPIVRFPYNDLQALETLLVEHGSQTACLIMEAENYSEPSPGYLQGVQALCQQHGVLFVLDEMITGFRWHNGGAQTAFGLQPDLSTFGKAMGNGLAVAALAGKRKYMELGGIEHDRDRVFLLSYTNGAETHGLAGALATLDVYRKEPVIEHLFEQGNQLRIGLTQIAKNLGIEGHFWVLGKACNLIYATTNAQGERCQLFRTLLLQELIKRKIFAPSLVVSYSHLNCHIQETIDAFEGALKVYQRALSDGVENFLNGRPSKPVFRAKN